MSQLFLHKNSIVKVNLEKISCCERYKLKVKPMCWRNFFRSGFAQNIYVLSVLLFSITAFASSDYASFSPYDKKSVSRSTDDAGLKLLETLQIYIPYFFGKNQTPESALILGVNDSQVRQALFDINMKFVENIEWPFKMDYFEKNNRNKKGEEYLSYLNSRLDEKTTQYDVVSSHFPELRLTDFPLDKFKTFFSSVNAKLKNTGVMIQWLSIMDTRSEIQNKILTTFYLEFPYGFTLEYKKSGDIVLVGSKSALFFNYESIKEKFNQNINISSNMKKFNIKKPTDLFWFFQLSRREVLNTLSYKAGEIALGHNNCNGCHSVQDISITNKQITNISIVKVSSMDIQPFVNENEEKFILFSIGQNFLQWGDLPKMKLIVSQLRSIDELWADALLHEFFFWKKDYQSATKLYQKHKKWLDITNYRQFEISLYFNKNKLDIFSEKVYSKPLKQIINARILYENKQWETLSEITPLDLVAFRWQLVGKINQGNTWALDKLTEITPATFENSIFLEILAKTYKNINDTYKAKWMRNQLTTLDNLKMIFFKSEMHEIKDNTHDVNFWKRNLKQINGEIRSS